MPTYEGIRLKILKYRRLGFAKYRRRKIKNLDFTIISNNCWGGMVYESYDLPKQSPTVGLFFMAEDYIEFLSDLKGYVNGKLDFIKPNQSKWKDLPEISGDKRFGSYPVGVLSNGKKSVEIFFLHYKNEKEAREKWARRVKRINWDKLLVKFNDQNGCTERELKRFISMPYKNKVFFTVKEWEINSDIIIRIKQRINKEHILASYEPFEKNRKIDIIKIINAL